MCDRYYAVDSDDLKSRDKHAKCSCRLLRSCAFAMLTWLQVALKTCASIHDDRLAVVMAPSCVGWAHVFSCLHFMSYTAVDPMGFDLDHPKIDYAGLQRRRSSGYRRGSCMSSCCDFACRALHHWLCPKFYFMRGSRR